MATTPAPKSVLADWNNTVGMVRRMVVNPAILKKFSEHIKPNMIFYKEEDTRVKGLRTLFHVLIDLEKERRVKELFGEGTSKALFAFQTEIRKLPDGDVKEEALNICESMITDPTIIGISDSPGCLVQFVDYLKAMIILTWSADFAEPYKQGKIVPATNLMKELLIKLDKLDIKEFQTLEADKLTEKFATRRDRKDGVFNFKIGSELFDGKVGFFEPKTLNIFMAPPGGGKSMMTVTLLAQAINQRRYVNCTIVEDRDDSFEPRLMAAITGIEIYQLKNNFNNLTAEERGKWNRSVKMVEEYLHIDYIYGENVETIHQRKLEIDQWRRAQGKPICDLDIIDYSMHTAGSAKGEDKLYEKLQMIYKHRKDFALKNNKIVFDHIQVNRSGAQKVKGGADMLEMTDIAGAFDVARVGDTIISINRSNFDKANKQAHFHLAKGRDGDPVGEPIVVPTLFPYGRYNMEGAYKASGEKSPFADDPEAHNSIIKEIPDDL